MTEFGVRWVWRTGLAVAGLVAGMAAHGQTVMAADEIAVSPSYEETYVEETYAAPPPPVVYRDEETYVVPARRPPPVEVTVLPPRAAVAVVRERGYEPLGSVRRRGFIYSVPALDPNGADGRVMVDARSGRVMEFVPAYAMSPRVGHEIAVRYGRFGQPIEEPRYAPRPPAGVPYSAMHRTAPHTASRTPAAVPVPRPRHVAKAVAKPAVIKAADRPAVDHGKPETAAADRASPATATATSAANKQTEAAKTQTAAAAESKTAGTAQAVAKPTAAKATASKPTEIELKPTQDMPPVQPLD